MNNNDVIEEALKNALRCFTVRRGEFYADKNFGSKIRIEQTEAEILAYARQSVAELDGVFVKSVEKGDGSVTFLIKINENVKAVTVKFD